MENSNGKTATLQDLRKVMAEDIPEPNYNRYDEVYPGIFVGDAATAKDIDILRKERITHILNSAFEPKAFGNVRLVRTNGDYYKKRNFKCTFCGIAALDHPAYPLIRHFNEASEFIDNALQANGRVFVHCFMGVSRSSTLVIAFLILKRDMKACEALRMVRNRRPVVRPNDGFLMQLCELDKRLNI